MKRSSLFLLFVLLFSVVISAQIPQTISYQGVLSDNAGEPVADGDYTLIFNLYTSAESGTAIWTEIQTLAVSNGLLNVVLGSVNPLNLPFDCQYWLGININEGAELTPRIELTSTAYALNARTVPDSSLTGNKFVKGQVVKSVNELSEDVNIVAGDNVEVITNNSENSIAISVPGLSGGSTLDEAYDMGGPGAGRQINADAGAVEISGPGGLQISGSVHSYSEPQLYVIATDDHGSENYLRGARIKLMRSVPDNSSLMNTNALNVTSEYSSSQGDYYAPKAVEARLVNSSTGQILEGSALRGVIRNTGSGTIREAYGLYNSITNMGPGTIEKAKGVFIASPYNTGTIENCYGLFVGNQNAGSNNYAIYCQGGKSFFADPVGIGTETPDNILTIAQGSDSDPIADAWTTYSSRRWKTNIQPIENALDKVQKLRGVSYDWKKDNSHDIGLIAEEVGKVIPQVVVYEENGIDARSVDYPRLVAVLIEAIKEQQQNINHQQESIEALQHRLNSLESK